MTVLRLSFSRRVPFVHGLSVTFTVQALCRTPGGPPGPGAQRMIPLTEQSG